MEGRRASCASSPTAGSSKGLRAGAEAWVTYEALGSASGAEAGEGVGEDPILISDWYSR
jgi:hypothetical protein